MTPVLTSVQREETSWEWRGQFVYAVRVGNTSENRSPLPPLLLVHGFGASTEHWAKTMAGLQEEFEIWAIDLLGFGRSAKPNWAYSGDLWREQLTDFIETIIGRPAVLVGNSLGGYASLCVAAQSPQAVAGVVLLNSAGPFSQTQAARPTPSIWGRIRQSVLLHPWVTVLLFQFVRRRAWIRKTLQRVYLDQTAVTDELVEAIYRPACDPGAAQVFASVFRTPQGKPVDELLARLQSPLLLLWGEGDPWMNTRQRSEQFRHHYPQLTEYFLQAGHCPHDEVPQEVNQRLREWVMALGKTES